MNKSQTWESTMKKKCHWREFQGDQDFKEGFLQEMIARQGTAGREGIR